MPIKMASNWNGLVIQERVDRACARAIIGIGTRVAVETKSVTHVISGTLRRSVHVAPTGYQPNETDEEKQAENQDLMVVYPLEVLPAEATPGIAIVEVGSWLPYACAEWVGRGHPGVTQGLELARTSTDAIVATAFAAEGLV